MDRALQNVIKGCINELMDMGFKVDSSKREIAALQNKMCNVVTSTMDEIAANSVLLNALIQHSNSVKGVCMQFDEIVKWWQSLQIKSAEDLDTALDG